MRLPSVCWICDGPLPMRDRWRSGRAAPSWLVPATAIGRRSMLSASTRSSGCRRTATSRDSPVGSTQSPTSTPANATRSACAASSTEMPSELARPRSSSICSSSFGSCSRQADVDRARHLAQLVHEVVGDRHQLARVGAGRTGSAPACCAPLFRSSSTDVLGADQAASSVSRRSTAISLGAALALGALADVDVDAAAAGVDVAVGGLGLRQRARQRGRLLHLQLRVLEADAEAACARRWRSCRSRTSAGSSEPPNVACRHDARRRSCATRDQRHPPAVVQRPGDDAAVAVGLVVEPVVEALPARLPMPVLRRVVRGPAGSPQ